MRQELIRLANVHRRELDALAQSWLANGAQGAWMVASGYTLGRWGVIDDGAVSTSASFTIPDRAGRPFQLTWCVALAETPAIKARLQADVALLERLFGAETDMGHVLDELVVTRDQLLAIMDLSRFTRAYLDVEPMLRVLTKEAQNLLFAESSFSIAMLPRVKPIFMQFPHKRQLKAIGVYLYKKIQEKNSHVVLGAEDIPHSFLNALMVPVFVQGNIAAGLGFFDSPHGFSTPAIKMAETIAELAGERLENILLYQENITRARLRAEMDLAWAVQAKLIPKDSPNLPGLDLYATYKPALDVGGDFYDFIPQNQQGNHTFVLGDVSGKGMSAAMVMTMMHTALRSAAGRGETPAEIVATANTELYDDFTNISVFSTLFVAQVSTGKLLYANAGHSPVIYCKADGDCELLVADGTAVGILPESFCENQTMPLQDGDVLVIATDGFSEAESALGELFGYDRLCEVIADNRQMTAEGIAHSLLNAIEVFSRGGDGQSDDQTILVIKQTGDA